MGLLKRMWTTDVLLAQNALKKRVTLILINFKASIFPFRWVIDKLRQNNANWILLSQPTTVLYGLLHIYFSPPKTICAECHIHLPFNEYPLGLPLFFGPGNSFKINQHYICLALRKQIFLPRELANIRLVYLVYVNNNIICVGRK